MLESIPLGGVLLGEVSPRTLFVLGLLVIIVVLLRRSKLGRSKVRGAARLPGGDALTAAERLTPPSMLTQWEVRMHDTARELSGQLDSKINILQHLVAAAEAEATRLENAIATARALHLEVDSRAANPQTVDGGDDDWQSPRLSQPGTEIEWLARRSAGSEIAAVELSAQRRETIASLSDGGYSRAAIAAQLGIPLGDVELVLSVRSRAS